MQDADLFKAVKDIKMYFGCMHAKAGQMAPIGTSLLKGTGLLKGTSLYWSVCLVL